jgi:ribosomal protein L37E
MIGNALCNRCLAQRSHRQVASRTGIRECGFGNKGKVRLYALSVLQ